MASPAVFDSESGYLSTLSLNAQGHQDLLSALCMSALERKALPDV